MALVITAKLGSNAGADAAAVTIRRTETGEVTSFTISASRELLEILLNSFDSNPNIRVKYE